MAGGTGAEGRGQGAGGRIQRRAGGRAECVRVCNVCARCAHVHVLTGEHSKRRTASEAKGEFVFDLSVMGKGFAAVACSRDRDWHTILFLN